MNKEMFSLHSRSKEAGYTLPFFVVGVYGITMILVLSAWNESRQVSNNSIRNAIQLLKGVMISPQAIYSVSAVRLGEVFCPDTQADGKLQLVTDFQGSRCKQYHAWFPWQRFSSMPLLDENYQALEYGIARGMENTANYQALNKEFTSDYWVNGHPVMAAVSGYDSWGRKVTEAIDITAWTAMITPFVLADVTRYLQWFYTTNGRYPDTIITEMGPPFQWLERNQWLKQIQYHVNGEVVTLALDNHILQLQSGKIVKW